MKDISAQVQTHIEYESIVFFIHALFLVFQTKHFSFLLCVWFALRNILKHELFS